MIRIVNCLLLIFVVYAHGLKAQTTKARQECERMFTQVDSFVLLNQYENAIKKIAAIKVRCPELSAFAEKQLLRIYTDVNTAKENERKQKEIATQESNIARSRYYSIIAQQLAETDPELATLIAIEAYKIFPGNEAYIMLLNLPRLRPQLEMMLHTPQNDANISSITGVLFYNENTLISAGEDGFIRFWNIMSGEQKKAFRAFDLGIDAITYNADRDLIAIAGADSSLGYAIRLIDCETGKFYMAPLLPDDPEKNLYRFESIQFAHNGNTLVSTCTDGHIYWWDVTTPVSNTRLKMKAITPHSKYALSTLPALLVLPDQKKFITGNSDGELALWDLSSKTKLPSLLGKHGGWEVKGVMANYNVHTIAANQQQTIIASGGADGIIRLWDYETGEQKDSLTLPALKTLGFTNVTQLVFAGKDDSLLTAIYGNGRFIVWDCNLKLPIFTNYNIDWQYDKRFKATIAYNKSKKLLAAARNDGQISIWKLSNGQQDGEPLTGHSGDITNIHFYDQSRKIISSGLDGTVRFWDLDSLKQTGDPLVFGNAPMAISSFEDAYDPVDDIEIDFGKSLMYVTRPRNKIDLVDLKKRCVVDSIKLKTLNGPDQIELNSSLGLLAIFMQHEDEFVLWDIVNKKFITLPLSSEKKIIDFKFQPKTNNLTFLFEDNSLEFWDAKKRKRIRTITGNSEDGFTNLFFNAGGSLLALIGYNDEIVLFDTRSFKRVPFTLSGHEGTINAIDFHPSKNILASSGEDGTIRLWSLDNYMELGTPFEGHHHQSRPGTYSHNEEGQLMPGSFVNSTSITSLKFSRDGKFIVSGASDGTIRFWQIDPAKLIHKARLQAGRKLTPLERLKYFGK